ncbi:MAG: non-canonical purine NTP pyrophosphatase [Dehalococcoidales bacterium]
MPDERAISFAISSTPKNSIVVSVDIPSRHQWVIADDSGLVVPTIGGAPGLYSARCLAQGQNLNMPAISVLIFNTR